MKDRSPEFSEREIARMTGPLVRGREPVMVVSASEARESVERVARLEGEVESLREKVRLLLEVLGVVRDIPRFFVEYDIGSYLDGENVVSASLLDAAISGWVKTPTTHGGRQ